MSKQKRPSGSARPSAKAPRPTAPGLPLSRAVLHGPPAPLSPPANGLILRLSPTGQSLICDLPSGRVVEVPGTPEGMDLLLGVLRRIGGQPRPEALSRCAWPKGLPVRFRPPSPSPWHEAEFWPKPCPLGYVPFTVEAEIHAAGGQPNLLATAPNGKRYAIPARHCVVDGQARQILGKGPAARAAPQGLTLEDLGL